MKKTLVVIGLLLFCVAFAIVATWNWISVSRLGPDEVSYVLQSQSAVGAIMSWMLPLLILGSFLPENEDEKAIDHAENSETIDQP